MLSIIKKKHLYDLKSWLCVHLIYPGGCHAVVCLAGRQEIRGKYDAMGHRSYIIYNVTATIY